ncbi:hypothetical protein BDZ94DRAFT_440193 [Collybia nuda]|uniref:Uncharacterized protein n=1 Tax=Collybia nuda TaxID=64659 RepID=A0A9P6CCJ0_9AGAR|nr:hypothetical protein BDZ94DRAFT_440193 [Collybia nuda]
MESRAICPSTVDSRELIYLIVPPVVQGIFYGVYLILFGLSIHIFRKRQLSRGHKSIFLGTVLLFLCCTFQCVIGSFPGGASTVTGYGVIDWFPLVTNALYVITNLVANTLFAYRCYVIWGRKKHILWLPSLLILAETGFGSYWCISVMPFGDSFDGIDGFDTRTPLIFTLATNVALTGLSAGRIWWISRELRILGPKVARKYNTIIALIVESGSIYCIVIAAYLISIPNNFGFGGFRVTTSEIVVISSIHPIPSYTTKVLSSNVF